MNRETQIQTIEAYTKERHDVMKGKSEDYANEADVLSNFKYVAMANGRTAAHVILDEVHKKVLRLQNLMTGKTPKNESIRDSVLDLSNYADILICALSEAVPEAKQPEPPKGYTHDEVFRCLYEMIKFDRKNMAYFGDLSVQIVRLYPLECKFIVDHKTKAAFRPMEFVVKFPTVIGEENTFYLTSGDVDVRRFIDAVKFQMSHE